MNVFWCVRTKWMVLVAHHSLSHYYIRIVNLPSVWLLHGGLGHILKSSQIWTPYAFFEQHFIPLETENGWLSGQSTDLSANRNIDRVNIKEYCFSQVLFLYSYFILFFLVLRVFSPWMSVRPDDWSHCYHWACNFHATLSAFLDQYFVRKGMILRFCVNF